MNWTNVKSVLKNVFSSWVTYIVLLGLVITGLGVSGGIIIHRQLDEVKEIEDQLGTLNQTISNIDSTIVENITNINNGNNTIYSVDGSMSLVGPNPLYLYEGELYQEFGVILIVNGSFEEPNIDYNDFDEEIEGVYNITYSFDEMVLNRTVVVMGVFDPSDFSRVILKEGVSEASNYTENASEVHPIIIFNEWGEIHNWNSLVPEEWTPSSNQEVELVLLLKEEETYLVEAVGPYIDSQNNSIWVKRYQYCVNATLIKARSGVVLNSTILWGTLPPELEETIPAWIREVYGDHVEWGAVEQWLEGNQLYF